MNLKKIIRETFEDEFEWAKEVSTNPFLLEQGNDYYVSIDIDLTEKQSRLVWDWLVEAGVTTESKVIQYGRVKKLTNQSNTFMIINSKGTLEKPWLISFSYHAKNIDLVEQRKMLKISDFFDEEEGLKEEQLDLFGDEEKGKDEFKWIKDVVPSYERCSHFSSNPKHKELCFNLYTLGTFLYKDLGLKNIINQKIRLMGDVKDLN